MTPPIAIEKKGNPCSASPVPVFGYSTIVGIDEVRQDWRRAEDMRAHGSLGMFGIAGFQGFQDDPMGRVGAAQFLRVMQIDAQVRLDRDMQRADLPYQLGPATQSAQIVVELAVICDPVAGVVVHGIELPFQFTNDGGVDPGHGETNGEAFQHRADLERFVDLRNR